jgi:hypothetical protein
MEKCGTHDKHEESLARMGSFFEALRGLQTERLTHIMLLFALAQDACGNGNSEGLSVAVLAHKAAIPLEAARHGVRALRMERLVCRAGRNARTEFFKLTPKAQETVLSCIAMFESMPGSDQASTATARRMRAL